MGFLSKLMGGPAAASDSGKPGMLVIDGNTFNSNNGSRSNLSPADQLQLLRRLARFAEKEKIAMKVGFDSQPLRKVEHGKAFEGVTVYFSNGAKNAPDMFGKLQRDNSGRHDVVVVTGNKDLESLVRKQGGKTMRTTTFKKAIDSGGSGGGGGGGGNRNNRRRSRGGRSEGGGGNREGGGGNREGGGGGNRNRGQRKSAPKKEGVEGLIDLVD